MARKTTPGPERSASTGRDKAIDAPSKPVPRQTKKARLIGMLKRQDGSTIAAISEAIGWQPHTTRAAITGLRKSGHHLDTGKPEKGRAGLIYRIVTDSEDRADRTSSPEADQRRAPSASGTRNHVRRPSRIRNWQTGRGCLTSGAR